MLKTLTNFFGITPPPDNGPTDDPSPQRTAATIRADLELMRDGVQPLASRITAAREAVSLAQSEYDSAITAFAAGQGPEPNRVALQAALDRIGTGKR